jgi:hypothetical protein
MTPEQITAERARLAKLRELNMPEPGAERLLAHIDTLTAAVLDVERLAEAMHGAYERDPNVKRIEWSDLSDAEKGMWKRHAAAVLAILEGK